MFYRFQFLLIEPHTSGQGKKKNLTNKYQDLFRIIAPVCNFVAVTVVLSYLQGIIPRLQWMSESMDSIEPYIYCTSCI